MARAIGIVKWYNGNNPKVCGIVVTNNFGTADASTAPGSLLEVEILKGSWKEQIEPKPRDWISFSLKNIHGRYIATRARKLDSISEKSFKIALQYVGQFSRIKGEVSQKYGVLGYDETVVSKCIERLRCTYSSRWQDIVRTAIQEHVADIPGETWQNLVDSLVADPLNFESLYSVYLPPDEYDVDDNDVVTPFFQQALIDKLLSGADVTILEKFLHGLICVGTGSRLVVLSRIRVYVQSQM